MKNNVRIANNKARFLYEFIDTKIACIVFIDHEIKAISAGKKVSIFEVLR